MSAVLPAAIASSYALSSAANSSSADLPVNGSHRLIPIRGQVVPWPAPIASARPPRNDPIAGRFLKTRAAANFAIRSRGGTQSGSRTIAVVDHRSFSCVIAAARACHPGRFELHRRTSARGTASQWHFPRDISLLGLLITRDGDRVPGLQDPSQPHPQLGLRRATELLELAQARPSGFPGPGPTERPWPADSARPRDWLPGSGNSDIRSATGRALRRSQRLQLRPARETTDLVRHPFQVRAKGRGLRPNVCPLRGGLTFQRRSALPPIEVFSPANRTRNLEEGPHFNSSTGRGQRIGAALLDRASSQLIAVSGISARRLCQPKVLVSGWS